MEDEKTGATLEKEPAATTPQAPEVQAPAVPEPRAEARPPAASGKGWTFDDKDQVLKINGKAFRLKVSAQDLVNFAQLSLAILASLNSVEKVIAGCEAGEWKSYQGVSGKLQQLHSEKLGLKWELGNTVPQFEKLFEPAGLLAEFAGNQQEIVSVMKTLVRTLSRS